tara:strand:+ start:154 stop:513 length:360 start_codon:yes stop_codon:yes gene_type:complete
VLKTTNKGESKMAQTKKAFQLSPKNKKLIINSCELKQEQKELTSTWNRILKPSNVELFELLKTDEISFKSKKLMYVLKRNVSTYNSFSVENFKKQHMDLFEKFSTLNTRTTWSSDIKEL